MTTMTSAARREQAKRDYDAFLATCPSRQLLEMIGSKWVGLVLGCLEEGPLRHSEIARRIAGISQKMLTQTLRELERDGLVIRTVTPSMPVRVDYELTALGHDLQAVVRPLKTWAEKNMDRILEQRSTSSEGRR